MARARDSAPARGRGVSSFYTLVDLYSAQARCYASSYRGTGTENRGLTPENSQMSVEQIIIPGIVKNGLVVPQGGSPLPEGVHVNIVIAPSLLSPAERAEFAGWERASDEAWAHIDQWEREEQL